jgi:hypothetical protein
VGQNMGKWWLITWTTYGSWIPGDERGFCTRKMNEYIPPPKRFARPGESTYDPDEFVELRESVQDKMDEPVFLKASECSVVEQALKHELESIEIIPAIMSVGKSHVHLLAKFDRLKIKPTVGRLKAAATRALNTNCFTGKRPWTKNSHMKSKPTKKEFINAFHYVQRHVNEKCLVHVWPNFEKMIGT